MPDPFLSLEGITKSVQLPGQEPLTILDGLDLDVNRGQTLAIVGRSGTGKTTLLNVLGLLDRPDAGRYAIEGVDTHGLGDARLSRLRGSVFGFVFQNFNLLDGRSALANVAAPLLTASRGMRRQRNRRAETLLDRVGLQHRYRATPRTLSGGEQQRVAIARSLARSPAVVLADEPTGSLDVDTGHQVLEVLFDAAHTDGCALVLITHDPLVAARADQRWTIIDGRLHPEGSQS